MSKDVERLFRNINQVNIPYQVFEPPTVPSPAIGHAETEVIEPELTSWPADPSPRSAKSKVFRKYLVEAEAEPSAGTPLKPIFDRLREKCRAVTKA
jgi:hypothetical protein